MVRAVGINMPAEIWANGQWPWTRPAKASQASAVLVAKHQPAGSRNPDTEIYGLGCAVAAVRYLATLWPVESGRGRDRDWLTARLAELIAHAPNPTYWRLATPVDVRGFNLLDHYNGTPSDYYTLPTPGPGPGQSMPGVAWTRTGLLDVTTRRVGLSFRFELVQSGPCEVNPPVWVQTTIDQVITASHRRTRWPLSLLCRTVAGSSLALVSQDWAAMFRPASLLRCRAAPGNTAVIGYEATRHAAVMIKPSDAWNVRYCTPGLPFSHLRIDLLPCDPAPGYGGSNDWGAVDLAAVLGAFCAIPEEP